MALTKIRQDQVLNLVEEIEAIRKKAETFETPVATYAELPMDGNDQGDLRVCLEDGRIYIWKGAEWVVPEPNMDEKYSKTIFKTIDQQTTVVNTGVRLDGVGEYITNNKYVNVHLNGQLLMNGGDFEIQEVEKEIVLNFNYNLEPEDILAITYGAKIMIGTAAATSGSGHTHENLETLSKISEADGKITFGGSTVGLANLSDGAAGGIQGFQCRSTGQYAVALGIMSNATGDYSFTNSPGSNASGAFATCLSGGYEASGQYSAAIGGNCRATKPGAIAIGRSSTASGEGSVAIGENATASGNYSFSFGAHVTGNSSFAALNSSNASGTNSIAMGGARAEGNQCIALGNPSTRAKTMESFALNGGNANAPYSIAALNGSTGENAQFSIACGSGSTTSASYGVAIGGGCSAGAEYAMAFGGGCAAGGKHSLAFGSGARTTGEYSVAVGQNNTTEGNYSVVMGYSCSTGLDAAHSLAFGNGVKTTNIGEVGFGQYNATSADTAFSIGNGTEDLDRTNLFEIKNDGSILSSKLTTEDKDIVGALNTLLAAPQTYSTETTYEELKTNDKTIIGAINELYDMIAKLQ